MKTISSKVLVTCTKSFYATVIGWLAFPLSLIGEPVLCEKELVAGNTNT